MRSCTGKVELIMIVVTTCSLFKKNCAILKGDKWMSTINMASLFTDYLASEEGIFLVRLLPIGHKSYIDSQLPTLAINEALIDTRHTIAA